MTLKRKRKSKQKICVTSEKIKAFEIAKNNLSGVTT
jgi:hypothetical protein